MFIKEELPEQIWLDLFVDRIQGFGGHRWGIGNPRSPRHAFVSDCQPIHDRIQSETALGQYYSPKAEMDSTCSWTLHHGST